MPKYTTYWLELTRTSFYRDVSVKSFYHLIYRLTIGKVNFPNSHLYAVDSKSEFTNKCGLLVNN